MTKFEIVSITKDTIKKRLNEGKNYVEIEAIAEILTYELIPQTKMSEYRYRYDSLYREDLEKLGYTIYEIGIKNKKQFIKKLEKEGFLYTYNCYFHLDKKEVYGIEDYPTGIYVSIRYDSNSDLYRNLPKLISREQYIDLTADKILKLKKEWDEIKNFFNSLIEKEKKFYEEELEEEIKNKIIIEALNKAKRKGLIKS